MTQFMDVHHNMVGITAEGLKEAHDADVKHQTEEGVTFLSAWADPKEGIVYCLSEGPSAEAVQRVHERTGHPADEIHEMSLAV
jgi:ferredoxin-NADP reductase